jgi:transcriptional regulator with XRE-family HTH domain
MIINPETIKLGERIMQLRIEKGLSQLQLACLMNDDERTIKKLEAGDLDPTILYLINLSQALDAHLRDFFIG